MGGFAGGFGRALSGVLAALLAGVSGAAADRIGGSNLPSARPALKGRIAEDKAASYAVVVSTGTGATSNAGPTFAEKPSVLLERGFGYAAVRKGALGQLDVSLNLADRTYPAFRDADERSAGGSLSLSKDWGGQQTILAVALASGRDVEERLTDTSLALTHAWTEGRARPYLKAEAALLDFGDIPEQLAWARNQDDRDRVSSRVQAGLKLTLGAHVEAEVGAGADAKRYSARHDDFGVRRDSVSLFPAIGLALTGERGTLKALYMPFWRDFREDLFRDGWVHGYAAEGELKLAADLKAFAGLRHGFEETDFLIASAAYEQVALAGLTLSLGKGRVSLAASRTWRGYEGLNLVDVARADEKLELALTGEMPLLDQVALNGSVSYLDYKSSFGGVGTDAVTALLGLTYTAMR